MSTTAEELETPSFQRYSSVTSASLATLEPNPWQPRQHMNQAELIKLAENIRLNGLINPITVRTNPNYETDKTAVPFQIAAGERRWRAFLYLRDGYEFEGPAVEDIQGELVPGEATNQVQGEYSVGIKVKHAPSGDFTRIPIIIRNLDDAAMMRIALGENGQRTDTTAMEEALAYARMIEHLHVTQSEFGKRMGLSQSLIANRLRMLKLPSEIRKYWIEGELNQWHAIKLLEWQNKYNLTFPYLMLLAQAFDKKQITQSYLDEGFFEDRIASLPGGRQLLEDEPLPVQGSLGLVEEVEAAEVAAPAPVAPAAGAYESNVTPEDDEDEGSGGASASASVTPAPAPIAAPAPATAQEDATPTPAPTTPDEKQRREAAASKFAAAYSSPFLLTDGVMLDRPTCRMIARLLVINAVNRIYAPESLVEQMQAWLRDHVLSDGVDQVHFDRLPVMWIDKELEVIEASMDRTFDQVIRIAVALTTECALASGDINPAYQGELRQYVQSAMKDAKEVAALKAQEAQDK